MTIRNGVSVMIAGDRMAGALSRISSRADQGDSIPCSDLADDVIRMIDQVVVSGSMEDMIRQWIREERFLMDAGQDSITRLQVRIMNQIRAVEIQVPRRIGTPGDR